MEIKVPSFGPLLIATTDADAADYTTFDGDSRLTANYIQHNDTVAVSGFRNALMLDSLVDHSGTGVSIPSRAFEIHQTVQGSGNFGSTTIYGCYIDVISKATPSSGLGPKLYGLYLSLTTDSTATSPYQIGRAHV